MNPFEVRALFLHFSSFLCVCVCVCRFRCLQSNWKSWRGEGQIAIPLLLIFLFAYAFPVLGSEWKTTEQFSAISLALHSFLLCVCARFHFCSFPAFPFPISHFAFRIQCNSFNGIAKAELGWDAANFPNTRYLKDAHTPRHTPRHTQMML